MLVYVPEWVQNGHKQNAQCNKTHNATKRSMLQNANDTKRTITKRTMLQKAPNHKKHPPQKTPKMRK